MFVIVVFHTEPTTGRELSYIQKRKFIFMQIYIFIQIFVFQVYIQVPHTSDITLEGQFGN